MPNKKKKEMNYFRFGSRSESAPVKKEAATADPWRNHYAREFLTMSTQERRKHYKCKQRYNTIDNIPMWSDKVYIKSGKRKRSDNAFDANMEIASKVSLWQGDITSLEIDAIVNAANNTLLGGGGVDGCIHSAAGNTLVKECKTLDGCDTGSTKISGGHKLPARYILHTVGPRGRYPEPLKNCYDTCLQITRERNLKTIAFCCISTGIYGYPNEDAAHVALESTRRWLEKYGDEVERIIFCTFLQTDFDIYSRLMGTKYFPCPNGEEKVVNDTADAEEVIKDSQNGAGDVLKDKAGGEIKDTKGKKGRETKDKKEKTEDTPQEDNPSKDDVILKGNNIKEDGAKVKENVKSPKDVSVEPVNHVSVEPQKDVSVEPQKDVSVEPPKDVSGEPPKDVSVEPPKDPSATGQPPNTSSTGDSTNVSDATPVQEESEEPKDDSSNFLHLDGSGSEDVSIDPTNEPSENSDTTTTTKDYENGP